MTTSTPPTTPLHTLGDLRAAVQSLWPEDSAEPWDRVGLVAGGNAAPVRKVLLAVDAVRDTVDEALQWGADVLITHHPLMLRGVHSVAEDTAKGAVIADLIRGNCALLAAHTNADIPPNGVSDRIAKILGIQDAVPIVASEHPDTGLGRVGDLENPLSLTAFAEHVAETFPATAGGVRVAGDPERTVQRIALCGGAGDSLLEHPLVRGADVYLTSDLRHHPAQDSLELSRVVGGPALIDVAHWASESLWLEAASRELIEALPGIGVRVSTINTDPWTFRVG